MITMNIVLDPNAGIDARRKAVTEAISMKLPMEIKRVLVYDDVDEPTDYTGGSNQLLLASRLRIEYVKP